MYYLDFSYADPAANLALDEALLLWAEEQLGGETLRLWELTQPAVVLGAGGCLRQEVYWEQCLKDGVPVLRRSSGGGTVVLGPGCLCFSLILRLDHHPLLVDIRASFAYILQRIATALAPEVTVQFQESDLVLNDRKVSGNAQQRKRRYLLHHGTLLYGIDAAVYDRYLAVPPRQPAYRRGRPHSEFVTNLPLSGATLRQRLRDLWQADTPLDVAPVQHQLEQLMQEKYGCTAWHWRR
jgi:lipoate-protein ligase A